MDPGCHLRRSPSPPEAPCPDSVAIRRPTKALLGTLARIPGLLLPGTLVRGGSPLLAAVFPLLIFLPWTIVAFKPYARPEKVARGDKYVVETGSLWNCDSKEGCKNTVRCSGSGSCGLQSMVEIQPALEAQQPYTDRAPFL